MELTEPTGQSEWQSRSFFERSYRCRLCGRKLNTVEVSANEAYEYDQIRQKLERMHQLILGQCHHSNSIEDL
jgi:hypothetical protein